jgi:ribonuclease P/MRP protein subunit RPP40
VAEKLGSGEPVDVIYLDFQKAFDKAPHERLLSKLKATGINGKLLRWIRQWLTGRKQRVVINGVMSDWQEVLSGIP